MKYLIYMFYVEAGLSALGGAQALFMPADFLRQFSPQSVAPLGVEIARWYGVLIFVLVYQPNFQLI